MFPVACGTFHFYEKSNGPPQIELRLDLTQ